MIRPDLQPLLAALAGLACLPLVIGLGWLVLRRTPGAPALRAVAAGIDRLNAGVGAVVAWAALLMVLLQLLIVLLRYLFGIGEVMLQEGMLYLHGMLFLSAAGFTLLRDGHVRVDVVYRGLGPRGRAGIDLLGTYLFLLPVVLFTAGVAYPYVEASWRILERSRETSGLPFVYVLKSFLLVFAGLLFLQAIAGAARAVLGLGGHAPVARHADVRV